jgi:ElaB/YqjD/DUF883 family membrane-anchored ribosome-binding protein
MADEKSATETVRKTADEILGQARTFARKAADEAAERAQPFAEKARDAASQAQDFASETYERGRYVVRKTDPAMAAAVGFMLGCCIGYVLRGER